uniref:Methyltransferase domain-containing protein n=1 Tax=Noctiluca scintillans TaxID=2966 RepID=A0A7S1AAX5_NOCSC
MLRSFVCLRPLQCRAMSIHRKPDRNAVSAFASQLNVMTQHSITLATAAVADRVGLFKLLANHSDPEGGVFLTVEQISSIGALHPRYVKEMCGCLACAGFLQYDKDTDGFGCDSAVSKVLADDEFALNAAGWLDMVPAMYRAVPGVSEAARTPERLTGIPFSSYSDWGFSRGMDRLNGAGIKSSFVRKWLPESMPEMVEKLQQGIKVADLGTGSGALAFSLANAFKNSHVTGIDLDERSVKQANALNPGLTNLVFQCRDMATIEPCSFDLIVNHDCIHDLVDPVAVLSSIRHALKPDGMFFSLEPRTPGESVAEAYELAGRHGESSRAQVSMMYGMSTLHCMTVSCAHGGLGLGCATFGPKTYEKLARDAGFLRFEVVGGSLANNFYVLSGGTGAKSAL